MKKKRDCNPDVYARHVYKQTNVYLPEHVKTRIKNLAEQDDRTVSYIVRKLIIIGLLNWSAHKRKLNG